MKVDLDGRPAKDGHGPFFAIRLYPETNEEMGGLEWAKAIKYVPNGEFLRCAQGDSFHYVIVFRAEQEAKGKQ